MKFTVAAVIAAAASGAAAWNNVTVVTETVDKYTTYCPAATQITHGNHTYTVTAPGTVTITDCPCTITRPVTTSSAKVNATAPVSTSPPQETPTETPSSIPTAGAGKAAALSGAGLAGLVGIAAFVL